ncbi:MAG: Fic family protein [Acidobacteriaceae bacterium]
MRRSGETRSFSAQPNILATTAEQGISELMVDLYRTVPRPLSAKMLFGWHRMVTLGRTDIHDIGRFRTSPRPMQIVSGASYDRKIHFEAPPSSRVTSEMEGFVDWFNRSGPNGSETLPALTRAGLAHLRFECVHPFEDGNGRVGRAIAKKALVQGFHPASPLIALAATILAHQRSYYDALEAANKANDATQWLVWFAAIAIEAQQRAADQVEFLIDKTKLLDRLRGKINARQEKAILRIMEEGPQGFRGGLSAGNYSTITGASPSTSTRDLAELVELNALVRSGELRHTRYALHLPLHPVVSLHIDQAGNLLDR